MDRCESMGSDFGVWIKPEDQLPETDGTNSYDYNVLCLVRSKQHPERGANIYIGKRHEIPADDGSHNFFGIETEGSEWTIWGWSYYQTPEVLAWMPLPNKPEGIGNATE